MHAWTRWLSKGAAQHKFCPAHLQADHACAARLHGLSEYKMLTKLL